jgi:hypothetical protein
MSNAKNVALQVCYTDDWVITVRAKVNHHYHLPPDHHPEAIMLGKGS